MIVFNEFERLITSTVNKINHKLYIGVFLENTKELLNEQFGYSNSSEDSIDPRWHALNNFKN